MLWMCAIISTELQNDFKALVPKIKPKAS